MNHNYEGEGFDQLSKLLMEMKKDPMSRRLIMTTYDPITAEEGVLYPCHGIVTQFYIRKEEGIKYVSCETYLRSNDIITTSLYTLPDSTN
jgi:thymidylate synthase